MSEPSIRDRGYCDRWVCTQCGICTALCPTAAITAPVSRDGCRYPVVDTARCVQCGLCARACPGPRLVGTAPPAPPPQEARVYGDCLGCALSHATDPALRHRSSSGGTVTALLISLRRRGLIAGAVVAGPVDAGGGSAVSVARTEAEIVAAAGSKYVLTSLADALREIRTAGDGPFAVVGLPCQIGGVRRAMTAKGVAPNRIALCVGLFCGGTKDFRYYRMLLKLMGLTAGEARSFEFRGGGWPGRIAATDVAGNSRTLDPKHPAVGQIWVRARYTPARCLVCDDPLAAAADLVFGDPWRLEYARDPEGNSVVIQRTGAGQAALAGAVAAGDVALGDDIPEADVLHSQAGILWRRHYAWPRARIASRWARGWRETVGDVPLPALLDTLKALRAFVLSQWI